MNSDQKEYAWCQQCCRRVHRDDAVEDEEHGAAYHWNCAPIRVVVMDDNLDRKQIADILEKRYGESSTGPE